MSWENNTSAAQEYSKEYKTELKVTSGTEVTTSISIGAAFEGLSMSMDNQVKEFTTYETTKSQTKTITVNVHSRESLTLYQRRYRFKTMMFFILDAWGEEWNAGSPGGYNIARKEVDVDIMSEDYLTTSVPLNTSATGKMTVKGVARANVESGRKTRKRENLTDKAKSALSKMGI